MEGGNDRRGGKLAYAILANNRGGGVALAPHSCATQRENGRPERQRGALH
jgi:hypothetical protein